MKKNILPFLINISICLILASIFSSCEDYVYKDIEGQWKLTEKYVSGGEIEKVDTVFYSFKKNVFKFLSKTNTDDVNNIHCFGNYTKEGNILNIELIESTFRNGVPDWDNLKRTYTIKSYSKSNLILEYKDTTYIFVKY
ncbi:MAG: lipocalin-like domain-containing protein [Dysgonomonas sp.]